MLVGRCLGAAVCFSGRRGADPYRLVWVIIMLVGRGLAPAVCFAGD